MASRKSKRNLSGRPGILAALAVLWLLLCGFTKAATYTGSEWAVNFWGTEMNTLDADLAGIRGDGFNSVVIVVPWRAFQPDPKQKSINSYAYENLGRIMEAAERNHLKVILRIGYTWDCYQGGEEPTERYRKLRTDPGHRAAWLDYVKRVYGKASVYPAFAGGFLTWEDSWNYVGECAFFGKDGAVPARTSGYADWLFSHYDPETISTCYGMQVTKESVLFPDLKSPARKFVLEWNDAWLNELLADSQQVFPDLSLEVRLDIDPVNGTDGMRIGVPHTVTFPAGTASKTCCMYAAAMGYPGGTVLSAEQGIDKAYGILSGLRAGSGGKPVFVDQFLYEDNTPGFEHNARLAASEISSYITGMAPVFEELCGSAGGYAVWSYRDYADNVIYNGQFGLGRTAWMLSGQDCDVRERDGNRFLFLQAGCRAVQDLTGMSTSMTTGDIVEFTYHVITPAKVHISTGKYSGTLELDGDGTACIRTGASGSGQLSISAFEGALEVDNIRLYSYYTEGGIRGADGSGGPNLAAIRALNASLPD